MSTVPFLPHELKLLRLLISSIVSHHPQKTHKNRRDVSFNSVGSLANRRRFEYKNKN